MAGELEYYGVPPSEQRDVESRQTISASVGQTVFPFVYQVGFLDVYRNGTLVADDEITAANGTSFSLTVPYVAGETIKAISRRQVPISDSYTKTEIDSLTGNFFGIAGGTGDAATVTTTPSLGYSEIDGREVRVRWPGSNSTSTVTISVNGGTVRSVLGNGATPVQPMALALDTEVTLRFNISKNVYEIVNIDAVPFRSGLTNLLYPSDVGGWRDIYKAGWRPGFLNQQWGGAQWGTEMTDGATGVQYKFDVATGYIDNSNEVSLANQAGNVYLSQGFRVPETQNVTAIWVKLRRVGIPTANLSLSIVADDGTGTKPLNATPITNGMATAQPSKVHTNNTAGDWYRFVFTASPNVLAGTQYHLLINAVGALTDASNYWNPKANLTKTYPYGNYCSGTSGLVFTVQAAYALNFVVESAPSYQFLQPAGQFSSKLVFSQGTQLTQSKVLNQPLRTFFNGQSFNWIGRISSAQVSKPIADFLLGLDHDRIRVSANASGFATVEFWDKAGTLVTLTSAVSVTGATTSDIFVALRAKGDGADYLQLWINGVKTNETSAQTYTIDPSMGQLGTAWVGGGFPVAPAWTQNMLMTAFPSAQGWTWTGSTSETTAMSIQNNRLLQRRDGYNPADNGYYSKTTTLNNATGWAVEFKIKATATNNLMSSDGLSLTVADGTKTIRVGVQEAFVSAINSVFVVAQGDYKNQDNVITLCGKGSDFYIFVNGKLAIDGTGQLTLTSATNVISFGDQAATSGENAEAVWSYVKYSSASDLTPQVSTGMALHEMAHFSVYKPELLSLIYRAGTFTSVKDTCDIPRNYVEEVHWSEKVKGLTVNPSTTSSGAYVPTPEMQVYVISEDVTINYADNFTNNGTANQAQTMVFTDGTGKGTYLITALPANGTIQTLNHSVSYFTQVKTNLGLHCHQERRLSVNGSTLVNTDICREFTVKSTNNAAF